MAVVIHQQLACIDACEKILPGCACTETAGKNVGHVHSLRQHLLHGHGGLGEAERWIVNIGDHRALIGPAFSAGDTVVTHNFAYHGLHVRGVACGQPASSYFGEAGILEIREPIVGGSFQRGGNDKLGGHEIEEAEAEIISGIDRRVARKQQVMRRGVPGAGCGPQEGANCTRRRLAKIEFVVNVVHVNYGDRLAFRSAQLGERTNLVCKLGSSKHYGLGTRLRAVEVRRIMKHYGGRIGELRV